MRRSICTLLVLVGAASGVLAPEFLVEIEVFAGDSAGGSGRVWTEALPEGQLDCHISGNERTGHCFERFEDAGGQGSFDVYATAEPGSTFSSWRSCPGNVPGHHLPCRSI